MPVVDAAASRRYLLVDDEEAHRELMVRAFAETDSGVELQQAATLDAARACLRAGRYDLILCDYRLPDGEGTELLRAAPQVPLVLLTAHGSEQVAVAALKAGAADYLVKTPAMFAALPDTCRRILRERELQTAKMRVEERLRERTAELEAIYDHAPVLLFLVDRDGAVRKANRTMAKLAGLQPDEVIGLRRGQALRCAEALRAPDGCGHGERCRDCRLRLALDECFSHGACPQHQEIVLPLRGASDGEHEAVFEASFTYLKLAAGPQVLVSLFDITARKQMEEELRTLTRFNEQVIDGAFDGIIVYDRDLRYLAWNRAMERISGVPAREVLGRHPRECFPFLEAEGIIARLQGVLQGMPSQVEFEYQLPSGRRGWAQDTSTPLRDAEGNIMGVIGQVRETTARKALELKLLESEERYRQLFAASPDAMFVLRYEENETLAFDDVNEACCARYGYSREEFLRLPLAAFDATEDAAKHERIAARLRREGNLTFETSHRCRDGKIVPVEVHAATFALHGQTMVLAVARDLTERKQAEQRLLQAGRMHAVGQLAAGVAHEFNNILQIIRSVSQAHLEEAGGRDAACARAHRTVIEQTERGGRIARGMLAFARPAPPRRQRFPLAELVRRVVELQKQPLANENVSVHLAMAADLMAYADPGQLEQVLVNLLLNARHALHPKRGGTIRIAAHVRDAQLRLSVIDDGIGMSEEVRQKALLPFFTTKGGFSDNVRHEGSGLGLSIIDAIARAHDGYCEIESALGKGTKFTVVLPVIAPESAVAGPARPAPRTDGMLDARILLVDDEVALQESIAAFLAARGATVVCAGDGASARSALADGTYDAVLLDLNLPQVNGLDLVREVRQRQPQARCVVITGVLDLDALSERLAQAGVSATLPKPFDLKELLAILSPG